ncbi:MAG: hypothetical protein ACLFVE_15645 [Chitinispirillaceae bacterium]
MNSDDLFKNESRVYTRKSLGIAAVLGGPLAAGYLISENFKIFDQKNKARKALITGIFATTVFYTLLVVIPEKYTAFLPNAAAGVLFPSLFTLFGLWWMERVQGKEIRNHMEQGGGLHSGWKAGGIGMVGSVITLAFVFWQAFIIGMLSPEIEGERIDIANNRNRVYYEGLDSSAAASVADTMAALGFFDINYDFFFKLEGIDNGYRFLFPAEKKYWKSPEIIGHYAAFKSFLEQSFPKMKIRIFLYQDGVVGRELKEITFDDPLSLQWMKKPSQKETKAQIAERVLVYLSFWEQFFQYGVDNDVEGLEWPAIPNVFRFASNGIGLVSADEIPPEWEETFYDGKSAAQAYILLGRSFDEVSWSSNAVVFKSHVAALRQMKEYVRREYEALSEERTV